MTKTTTGIMS